MRIRGFILGVFLLALVGWCVVFETMKQTQARYALAEAARNEDEVKKRLEKLRAAEEGLMRPARLAAVARDLKLDVANLGVLPQDQKTRLRSRMAAGNRWDEFTGNGENGVRVATANRP